MKMLLLFLAVAILSACNKSSDASAPSCALVPKAPLTLTQSQVPSLTEIALDQKSLIQLMSYTHQDSTCYVKLQENVSLEKIKRANQSPNNEFSLLDPANPDRQTYWNAQEKKETVLMGLTIFSYVETESAEQIKQTAILLTDTVRPWHLWHEFSHYLIVKMRMTESQKRFAAPKFKKLETAKNILSSTSQQLLLEPNNVALAQQLASQIKSYINLNERYMEVSFAHEITIELTLSDLVRQLKNDARVSSLDLKESENMVRANINRYAHHWQNTKQELADLIQVHSQNPVIRNTWQSTLQPTENKIKTFEHLAQRQRSLNHKAL